jgi:hypothetical protein
MKFGIAIHRKAYYPDGITTPLQSYNFAPATIHWRAFLELRKKYI